jgi:hypothetical protein
MINHVRVHIKVNEFTTYVDIVMNEDIPISEYIYRIKREYYGGRVWREKDKLTILSQEILKENIGL